MTDFDPGSIYDQQLQEEAVIDSINALEQESLDKQGEVGGHLVSRKSAEQRLWKTNEDGTIIIDQFGNKTPLNAEDIYNILDLKKYHSPGSGFGTDILVQHTDLPNEPHGAQKAKTDINEHGLGNNVYKSLGHTTNIQGHDVNTGGAPYYADFGTQDGAYTHSSFVPPATWTKTRALPDPQSNRNMRYSGMSLHDEFSSHATSSPYVLLDGDYNPYLTAYDAYLQDAWTEELHYLESTGQDVWFPYLGGKYYAAGGSQWHPGWLLAERSSLSRSELDGVLREAEEAGKVALLDRIQEILDDPDKNKVDYLQLLDLIENPHSSETDNIPMR